MKKVFLSVLLLSISLAIFSQKNSGLGFNYQAVVRGADGYVIASKDVEIRFSLFPGQHATSPTWVETHKVKTDQFGTIAITIGKGTKSGGLVNSFSDVNFSGIYYWIKTEIKDGSNYREIGFSQLPSTPYSESAYNVSVIPPGTVVSFAGDESKIPDGWLLCDGREVSRSDYANLYNAIRTAWGHGNNSTTFNLPDMRGMFLRGVSGNSGKDIDSESRLPSKEGSNSGNNIGSLQNDAIRNIIGTVKTVRQPIEKTTGAFCSQGNSGGLMEPYHSNNECIIAQFDASRVVPVGADNRPVNVYVNYIIKY